MTTLARTGVGLLLLFMLGRMSAAEDAAPARSEPTTPGEKIAVDRLQPVHPKEIVQPSYPESERRESGEGWVRVGFMVDTAGKPYEVAVLDSTGNKTFDEAAVKAMEQSVFQPALTNGQPIESAGQIKYLFLIAGKPERGANPDYVENYRAFMAAIKVSDRSAADAAMSKLQIRNLYEDAYYGVVTYNYAAKWGTDLQQLKGLRRAIAGEDRASYLPADLYQYALRACLQLELKLHYFGEAQRTWERLQKSNAPRKVLDLYRPGMAQMAQFRTDAHAYDVAAQIPEDGLWNLRLYKRHFQVAANSGYLANIKLRCEKGYIAFAVDPQLVYQVAEKYGDCELSLEGTPGTAFTLTQS